MYWMTAALWTISIWKPYFTPKEAARRKREALGGTTETHLLTPLGAAQGTEERESDLERQPLWTRFILDYSCHSTHMKFMLKCVYLPFRFENFW
jgi:hypothetical protein